MKNKTLLIYKGTLPYTPGRDFVLLEQKLIGDSSGFALFRYDGNKNLPPMVLAGERTSSNVFGDEIVDFLFNPELNISPVPITAKLNVSCDVKIGLSFPESNHNQVMDYLYDLFTVSNKD